MTLARSIWNILCCKQQNALVVFTPAVAAENANRRILASTAHKAIAQALLTMGSGRQTWLQLEEPDLPNTHIPSLSAYELFADPLINPFPVEDSLIRHISVIALQRDTPILQSSTTKPGKRRCWN